MDENDLMEEVNVKVVADTKWQAVRSIREISVDYNGSKYDYRRWFGIPIDKYDDYDSGDEWGKDNKHLLAEDVPQELIQFVNDYFEEN